MEILPVMTVAELEDLTLNDDLLDICQTQPFIASKIINQASMKIRSKIDKEIFYDESEEGYKIPDDLKYACSQLCEGICICDKEKNNVANKKVVSEKIDDYSISYSDSQSAYTFFGIPVDSDVIAIIESYTGLVGRGFRGIHLH